MIGYYLGTLEDVEFLANTCSKYNTEIDAISSNRVVDAKSILGLVSLLGKWVTLHIIMDNRILHEQLESELAAYNKKRKV